MKQFIKIILSSFFLPCIVIIISVLVWDPFRVFFNYDDYYSNNPITGNREDICFKLLKKTPNKISNFIIGNSRSQSFKTAYWCKKINQPSNTAFHYDGSGFGLYRTTNAVKYLANQHQINNILLIVDTDFFEELKNPIRHLNIQRPEVSEESRLVYYRTFIKASLDFEFIMYNLIFNFTGKYFGFMGHHINKSKNSFVSKNSTGDIWYPYDNDIKSDSISYYSILTSKGVFYNRQKHQDSRQLIGLGQLKLLNEINHVVKKKNINLKIVISPLYNQIAFNDSDKQLLNSLFGCNNVYDFSGQNHLTDKISNYYENSHYKPYVANEIMDLVYTNNVVTF